MPPSASGFHGDDRQQTHTDSARLLVLHVLQFVVVLKVKEEPQTAAEIDAL